MSNNVDPVAEKSDFLCTYMSDHPETLIAFARWYGQIHELMTSAEMIAIDTQGMTLICTLKKGGKRELYISINPPLKGYEDVKPRLLEMKALAQEGLGIVKPPQVTTFYFPPSALFTTCLGVIPTFCYYAPPDLPSPISDSVVFIQGIGGMTGLQKYVYLGLFLHALECIYATRLCRKHCTGFGLGALYVSATFICGFPIWMNLHKEIRALRIDSVMKVE
ncbi:hypothetical protein AN958_05574 [Leucoagaricus sp. SymC.cos]|nr:hypothetical protein AN958_05574 [Leucoagaricus sp. SymC.cos]